MNCYSIPCVHRLVCLSLDFNSNSEAAYAQTKQTFNCEVYTQTHVHVFCVPAINNKQQTINTNNMTTLPAQAAIQHQCNNNVERRSVPEYLQLTTVQEDQYDSSHISMLQGQTDHAEREANQSIADSESTRQESAATVAGDSTHEYSRQTEGIYNEAYDDATNENGEGVYSDVNEQNDEVNDSYGTGAGRGATNTIYQARQDTHWTIKRCFSNFFCCKLVVLSFRLQRFVLHYCINKH